MKPFYVYILKCNDNSYYTGQTDDIEKRLAEHINNEKPSYTSTRLPIQLVFLQEFMTREEAIAAERQIQGWSRKKKEALIAEDWDKLRYLSNLKKNTINSNASTQPSLKLRRAGWAFTPELDEGSARTGRS
jgi:predicted GIY-YIG superfamily endonuclease